MDDAQAFAATHDIRVVYAADQSYAPSEFVAYRLALADQVGQIARERHSDIQVLNIIENDVPLAKLKEIRVPERPDKDKSIVTVLVRKNPAVNWSDWNIGEDVTDISANGKSLGAFRSGFVMQLPKFPFLNIGCQFDEGGGHRKCFANLLLDREPIESRPASVDLKRFDDPVSLMLGIPKQTSAELEAEAALRDSR